MVEFGWVVIWAAFISGVVLGFILSALFGANAKNIDFMPDESLPPHKNEGRHESNIL